MFQEQAQKGLKEGIGFMPMDGTCQFQRSIDMEDGNEVNVGSFGSSDNQKKDVSTGSTPDASEDRLELGSLP